MRVRYLLLARSWGNRPAAAAAAYRNGNSILRSVEKGLLLDRAFNRIYIFRGRPELNSFAKHLEEPSLALLWSAAAGTI